MKEDTEAAATASEEGHANDKQHSPTSHQERGDDEHMDEHMDSPGLHQQQEECHQHQQSEQDQQQQEGCRQGEQGGLADEEDGEEKEEELVEEIKEEGKKGMHAHRRGEVQQQQQGLAPKSPRRKKGTACTSCRDSKTRCDKTFPCSRCYKLCLDCRPQTQPLQMQGKETEGEERTELRQQEWEEEEEGGEEEEEEEEKDGGHAPPAAKTSFLLDLAIQRNSPRGMVADYVHAFHQLYQEGVVDRQQVLKSMRMWRSRSILVGADISWGITAELCKIMSFSPTDLEVPEDLLLDRPIDMIRAKAQAAQYQAAVRDSESIKATATYRSLTTAEQVAACVCRIEQDRFCIATNAACRRLFRDAHELINDHYQRKTIVHLIMGALVCPEDRPLWFRGMVQGMFSTLKETYSQLIKMYDRDGQISLYIFQSRNVEEEEGVRAHTVSVERAPRSRHVCACPEGKGVIKRFRLAQQTEDGSWVQAKAAERGREKDDVDVSACPLLSLPVPSSPSSWSSISSSSMGATWTASTAAAVSSRLQHAGPAAAFPPLAVLLRASVPPLAHFPLGLDASILASQGTAAFAADVLASGNAAIIFPPLEHTFQGALAPAPPPSPPPDLVSAATMEPVSLAMQEQQQEFARHARKAEVRRRGRRLLKQQQQEQKEREKEEKLKSSETEARRKEDKRGRDGERSKRQYRGEEGGAEVGGRNPPPPPPIDALCSSAASSFLFERSALLPTNSLWSPLPSPPPLALRGGLAARRAAILQSHRSPISELGPVPVLDEIPGALAVFEEEEG